MNFSNSNIWNNSLYVRYSVDKIKKIGDLCFYDDNNVMICQNFFEPNIGNKELDILKDEIMKRKQIKFNYINDSQILDNLKKWAIDNNYVCDILDCWEAPQLLLDDSPCEYFKKDCGAQIKRNYNNYMLHKKNFKFYNSEYADVLMLWNYVLYIDFNSWKKEEQSDMKSLNREDLQYLPFLLLEKDKSSLVVVCDSNDIPLAYSLMFKGENEYWYAVKWGASYLGRKNYAGFYCLFNHLEYLYCSHKKLYIDFWGRRNKTYDSLKNKAIVRNHILIYKKED